MWGLFAAFCVCVLGMTVLTSARPTESFQQGRDRHIRTVQFTSKPIAEMLRPDDDIVVVEWNLGIEILDNHLNPSDALQAAVAAPSVTAAIVTVTGVSGVLALENAWIHTKFVAIIDELLKVGKSVQQRNRVARGQAIEFFVHGGEVAVNGVVVRARDVVRYPIARKYLVFLHQKMHENGWTLSSSVPLLIDSERLSAVAPARSDISGLTLADVKKALRASR